MYTKLIIGIFALAFLAGGVVLYTSKKGGESMMKEDGVMMNKEAGDGAMMEQKDAMPVSGEMQKDAMVTNESVTEGESMMEKDSSSSMTSGPGSYIPYTPDVFARAEKGTVVLFFRASWCPFCKALNTDIRAHLDEIPSGLTIVDVDYDKETALRQKYGVTYQHTMVQVDKEGNQIHKWSGSPTLAKFVAEVR
jgi:thioredoxin 1